ncbi:MAG: pyruvate/2-oxoglutarate/acetoin dehydrogenase E1 component/TPP-dependent pyruvate [Spirosomataceae bacterium]|jgi:pyruvate/2-oxoglutarate/acetoin dehydrogenase E1 component/TPP-dependent pyruvate/acetoin dehydrogenase alpha subunit
MTTISSESTLGGNLLISKEEVLLDYKHAVESREVSILGRKDVFMGRAKFGIFGDGKEVAQLAMAKVFRKGDFRSGYYRDQTLLASLGILTWQQFFAQLYAHADLEHDPFSGGRSMNAHYGNRWFNEGGDWLPQTKHFNSVMDVSSTAGQVPRSIGLGYASKLYRENADLSEMSNFSKNGNEVCFVTIGDASTSQGMFFEGINAAGVLQVPVIFSVWDDGFGISVPKKFQTTKQSISEALSGFQRTDDQHGIEIITARGWDYPELIQTYQKAACYARDEHVPVLVHVEEMTQPQGHSASGSHERYKTEKRLNWEAEHDCNIVFRNWILENSYASEKDLEIIEKRAKQTAKDARKAAWDALKVSVKEETESALDLIAQVEMASSQPEKIKSVKKQLQSSQGILRKDIIQAIKKVRRIILKEGIGIQSNLSKWIEEAQATGFEKYSSHVYSETKHSPLKITPVAPKYAEDSEMADGRTIINKYFDSLFESNPLVFAIGEDVGKIGDVNQGFAGLQDKYGKLRITDVGIREATIIGQGIGAAMRGLRPIVEIQYFDYIFYALATLTDDLACLRYRTKGGQAAPLIVRTRGHRLEGIWHSGSPMGTMLNSLQGMHIAVPRNFVQAAGMYNTLITGDDPALMIECLNGYRLKEKLPSNLKDIRVPLGVPETIRKGTDVTVVTYGSMCRIVMEAAKQLSETGIEIQVIDVQTLLPFDLNHSIVESIKQTNRVIFADEDMPGGGAAFMMQEVIDKQNAYRWLDSKPTIISAQPHRPSYGSDGDYFSKPNADTIFDGVYELMHEANPTKFPVL